MGLEFMGALAATVSVVRGLHWKLQFALFFLPYYDV